MEATVGFEPTVGVLQTPALPLGYVAPQPLVSSVTGIARPVVQLSPHKRHTTIVLQWRRKVKRDNGQGTVYQRGNGRWAGSLMVNGRRRWVYGRSEREAKRKLLALQNEVARAGDLPNPGRRTVTDLIDAWLDAGEATLKPGTVAYYRKVANAYIIPKIGRLKLTSLTPDAVQRLVTPWQKAGKHRTATKIHAVLHRACQLAVLWGWLAANPCDRILRPAYRATRKEMWSADELTTFLTGARDHPLYPLYLLLVTTGLRLGEALALTWNDLDLTTGLLAVRRSVQRIAGDWVATSPKTRAGERAIGLPADVVTELKRHRVRQIERLGERGWNASGLVFTNQTGGVLCPSVVQHNLARLCNRLGIPRLTAHGLRHLHASLLISGGLPVTDVSRRLGHANAAVTMTVYAHAIGRSDDHAVGIVERVLKR
jgi:integrase